MVIQFGIAFKHTASEMLPIRRGGEEMKSRTVFLTGLTVVTTMLIFAASAFAGTYTCKVKQAGPYKGTEVRFVLTDTAGNPAFSNKTFIAKSGCENQMLATALTAISNGLNVRITTSPSQHGRPVIHAMVVVVP
jgi:hypothetical protein